MAKRNIGDCIRYGKLKGIVKNINAHFITPGYNYSIYWNNYKRLSVQSSSFVEKECELMKGSTKIWNILYG